MVIDAYIQGTVPGVRASTSAGMLVLLDYVNGLWLYKGNTDEAIIDKMIRKFVLKYTPGKKREQN